MVRLRKTFPDQPGWTRRKHGSGFTYRAGDRRLNSEERGRCETLVIPPAWTDVWISPHSNGHIQAVGTDDQGRRQYIYHELWRARRDREKFESVLDFAARLPQARRTVRRHLADERPTVRKVSALAFRMLDVGAFRIGSPRYTEDNGSHGLLTLERQHLRFRAQSVHFSFTAKSGLVRTFSSDDALLYRTLKAELARTRKRSSILEYRENNSWERLTSEQFTTYLRDRLGADASAKQFRTWRANVVAAAALACPNAEAGDQPNLVVKFALNEVAEHLGNTPAVAKSSYVDPRLFDLYAQGLVLSSSNVGRVFPVIGRQLSETLERDTIELLSQ